MIMKDRKDIEQKIAHFEMTIKKFNLILKLEDISEQAKGVLESAVKYLHEDINLLRWVLS